MKFTELEELMYVRGITTLADIARNLETTPQAVSNWKARDQVPYHVVAILNDKIDSFADTQSQQLGDQRSQHMNKDVISLSDILLIIAEQLKVIVLTAFIIVFFTFTYVRFIMPPEFVSSATILLPESKSANLGGLAGLASQFGVNVPSGSNVDLSSPSLFPDLLVSRTFAEKLLMKEFYTKKYSKKLSLLAVLTHGLEKPKVGKDTLITRSLSLFGEMLQFKDSPNSPFSTITATAFEPELAKELADVTISELELLNRYYKSQTVQQKLFFISNRIKSVEIDLRSSEIILKQFNEENRQISSPSLELELERLSRDVEIQKGIYLTLKQQYELAKIEEVQEASIVQILDKPQIPLNPSNKNLSQIVPASGFIGLILGVLLGFLRSLVEKNDIDERKKIRRVKHFIKKKTKDIFFDIRISKTITFLLLLGMPIYLGYRSDNPTYFGMYSTKIMILNTLYILAFFIFLGIYISLNKKK